MWSIEPLTQWIKDYTHYNRQRPPNPEFETLLFNVSRYAELLGCSKTSSVQARYLHFDGGDVISVDQTVFGCGANQPNLYVYTYADRVQKLLYLITIGNNETRAEDICYSQKVVTDIFKN